MKQALPKPVFIQFKGLTSVLNLSIFKNELFTISFDLLSYEHHLETLVHIMVQTMSDFLTVLNSTLIEHLYLSRHLMQLTIITIISLHYSSVKYGSHFRNSKILESPDQAKFNFAYTCVASKVSLHLGIIFGDVSEIVFPVSTF